MWDLAILGPMLVVALGVGSRMLAGVTFPWLIERALFAIALGLALLAYVTLALGEMGLLRWPALVAVLVAGGYYGWRALVSMLAAVPGGWRRWRAAGAGPFEWAALLLGLGLIAAQVVLVLAPPVGGDQTKYQLVYPQLFAGAHRLVATPWSFWGYVQYLANMLFTAAFVLRGDVLARLLNVAYSVLLVLAIFATGRRLFSRAVGVWAALLFITMPLTTTLTIRAWVDLPLTLYVLLAVFAVLTWSETGSGSWLALGALMAGFAGGTKVMGLLAPAWLGVLVFARGLARDGVAGIRRALVAAAAFGLIAGAAASPCYVRNAVETGNPIFPFGYGFLDGRHWSAEAARGLDDYYAGYREAQAERRGARTVTSWVTAVRFPWDVTMAPHSFEEVGRSAYDIGPFLLAFAPGLLLLRDARAWLLAAIGLIYGATVVLGMWAHPRYVHPALPLLLLVAVRVAEVIGRHPVGTRVVTAVLAATVLLQTGLAVRVMAPLWPDSVRVALGRMPAEAFLLRHERRYPLWSLVNAHVPEDGNVLVLGMIPHPYHLTRRFTLASPLEQNAIDYRRIETVEEFIEALKPYGITHVVRGLEREKRGANPVGERVTRLWDALLARCEKIAEIDSGTLYRLTPAVAGHGDPGPV